MTDDEYRKKISEANSLEEKERINEKFMKSKRLARKSNNFKSWFKDNFFNILNALITILALVVAILSLMLQFQERLNP